MSALRGSVLCRLVGDSVEGVGGAELEGRAPCAKWVEFLQGANVFVMGVFNGFLRGRSFL